VLTAALCLPGLRNGLPWKLNVFDQTLLFKCWDQAWINNIEHFSNKGNIRHKIIRRQRGGLIPSRIDIAYRPAIFDVKSRLRDWELVSTIVAKHRGAITSMVERKTTLTILVLLDGPTSEATKEWIIRRLIPHKKYALTLTSDSGEEFAGHMEISEQISWFFYFWTPYHSWERGLNQNTNWLMLQYFSKGMDVTKLTVADVQCVEDLLNNRPPKALNYRSPVRSSPSS
jgi:IS30 family transposase